MNPVRRIRALTLLILAVLVWTPGMLYAGCAACPFGKVAADHRCCPSGGAALTMQPASCCETLRTATPVETSRAVVPSSALALSPAPPVELPGAGVMAAPIAELPLSPPPLHDGIGLYTLHAAFLI